MYQNLGHTNHLKLILKEVSDKTITVVVTVVVVVMITVVITIIITVTITIIKPTTTVTIQPPQNHHTSPLYGIPYKILAIPYIPYKFPYL